MQLNRILLVVSAAALFVCSSCKKNHSDEQYIEDPNLTTPDLSLKINTSVAGFIMDENNEPLAGAQVAAGAKQAITDEYGYFKISNTFLAKAAGFITVSKAGYYKNIRTFTAKADKETFLKMQLLNKTETGNFDAAAGGTISTSDGGKIVFPANGLLTASDNAAYSGTVHVSARTININSANSLQQAVPGDGRGIDEDGHLKLLKPYATIVVELIGNSGEKLQLATGKPATLAIPVNASQTGSAPASVPFWSLDENTGLWKQEVSAVKTGNTYTATVPHFSFWEGADPSLLVNLSAQVVNTALQPLANVAVLISSVDNPQNYGFGYTDADGNINAATLANTSLKLDVLTTCFTSAYAHNFTTSNSDIDLGTLTGNLGQSMVTITGTVTNCSGQPVTNGYVQTYDGGFYNRINIVNGSFSFTGLACINTPVNYIVVDNTTNQQDTPQTINLAPGTNNLGALTACGISSVSVLTYIYDGVTHVVTQPADTMAAYYSLAPNITNIIQLNRPGGGSGAALITFEISNGNALGSNHYTGDIWFPAFPSGRGRLSAPVAVTITEFGNTGGYISGSFSATNVQDFDDPLSIHTISVNFRVRRQN